MFLFFLLYFTQKNGRFLDDIFQDIEDEMLNYKHNEKFHEKFENVMIFTFCSRRHNILYDLIEMNEENDILNCLKGDDIYYMENLNTIHSYNRFRNKNVRFNLSFDLDILSRDSFRKINKLAELKNCKWNEILQANKNILKLERSEEKNGKYSKKTVLEESGLEELVLVTNMKPDIDIFLFILKASRTYGDTIDLESVNFYNFLILKFENSKSKIEFDKTIKRFYEKNNLGYEKINNIIHPFIIAEFAEPECLTDSKDWIAPNLEIRSMFDENNHTSEFLNFKENLELIPFKKENNFLISKRPAINIKYSEEKTGQKIKKECIIYSHVFDSSIKIICETEETCLEIKINDKDVYKSKSKLSIYGGEDDKPIQTVENDSFYFYENKRTKKSLDVDRLYENQNEIVFTDEVYENFKKNVFLCLNPSLGVFYNDRYITYDFIGSDLIFMNLTFKWSNYIFKKKSIVMAYELLADKVLNFGRKNSNKYDIYYFNCVNDKPFENRKSRTIFIDDKNRFSGDLFNVTSFKKIKINDNFITQKLRNIDEIIILLENKTEMANSIYIHFNVKETILSFFKSSYEEALIGIISQIENRSNHNYKFSFYLKNIENSLQVYILEVLKKFLRNFKSYNVISFKYLMIENEENPEDMKNYLLECFKGKFNIFSKEDDVFLKILRHVSEINKNIYQDIVHSLLFLNDEIIINVSFFTPSFYHTVDDLDHLFEQMEEYRGKRFIRGGVWKKISL